MKKSWLVLTVFVPALLVNPYLACSSSDAADFTYSEADMKHAVLGTWEGSADLDGESVAFSLELEQASTKSQTQGLKAPSVQPQCGSRSFVKPAAACISRSDMQLSGVLTSQNPTLNGAVEGEFEAYRNLDHAQLTLRLDDGTTLTGVVNQQAVSDGGIFNTAQVGTFSLSRP